MAIKVHGAPNSTATARVLLCLCEKGLQYQLHPVDLAASLHKTQPHLSLNPFGQIPALEDDDISVFESRAINRYLARKYESSGSELIGLKSFRESASVETWMEVEAHQFNAPISTIVHQIMVNPVYGLAPDEQVIESEVKKLEKVVDVYEERLSKCKYLAGDDYSLADLHHIPYLVYYMRTPKAYVVTSHPRVNRWWNDISSRPATIQVSEAMEF